MTLFVGILSFFVILALLIFVHELGHFTMAKLFRVRVDEFGLGFPPRLKTWKRGGTLYSINAIPLGGFVKMLGENGRHLEPDSFGAKPPWQRFIILTAGPGMNLLVAILVGAIGFMGGSPRGLTTITGIAAGSPAAVAGLHINDRIVAVDKVSVKYLSDLQLATDRHQGQRLSLRVVRGGKEFGTSLIPRVHPPKGQGPMGIVLDKTVTVSYGPVDSVRQSVNQVGSMVASIPLIFQAISQHGGSSVSGPIGIAQATTQVVHDEPHQGFGTLFQFVAFLSASLGVLNLLPIPALDGGRIVFVLISWVRRRNLDPEVEGVIHMVGMAALLLLIMVISYNDLVRWVSGSGF